ncbi:hypothetical protein HXY33_02810 [Candidatus Bathyarchaeota archaeon]|nr:hypothetical protein [Candidatus Bathyarchaeota archaeon]
MNSQNRGQIRIIEAFLAVLVIFSSFAVSSNLSMTQSTQRNEDLFSIGFQALMRLDSDGSLGKYVDDGNWAVLRDALSTVLPAGICFNLTVYNDQMQQVNNVTISNGGFSSQQIIFVEYLFAIREIDFCCYIIHLHLAVAT